MQQGHDRYKVTVVLKTQIRPVQAQTTPNYSMERADGHKVSNRGVIGN